MPEVKTAATLFQMLCYNNKAHLQAGIICAGWDKHHGGSVYNIPLGGSIVKQPFAIGGTLPPHHHFVTDVQDLPLTFMDIVMQHSVLA